MLICPKVHYSYVAVQFCSLHAFQTGSQFEGKEVVEVVPYFNEKHGICSHKSHYVS